MMIKLFITLLFITVLLIICYSLYPVSKKTTDEAINIPNDEYQHGSKTIYDFGYILNSNSCLVSHKILLIITSYAGHVELRSAHRRAIPQPFLDYDGIKRVFLLSKIPSNDTYITQEALKNENDRFDDIIQGDFIESYRNLTFKHIMGLRWGYNHCPLAEFILKFDDDMVFNLLSVMKFLQKYKDEDKSNFLLGYVLKGMTPIRNKQNKWYVLPSEYNKSFYPPFLSGWMYVTTPLTAAKLVSQAFVTPYFWIDDVFVTGILASKQNMKLKDFKPDNIYLEHSELMDCCINDMNNKNISCEYSVAPNGGDTNKIVKFQKALEGCFKKRCQHRSPSLPLSKTCIVSKDNFPKQKGKPLVHVLKL